MEENNKIYTCKNDRVFKEIFMKEENKDLLITLLESILDIKIKELKYLNLEKNVDNIKVRRKHFDLHVKTDKENIQIEVNSQMSDYVRPRNAAFLFDTYSHNVKVGGDYNEEVMIIQINFTYGLGENSKYYNDQEDNMINTYRFVNDKCKPFIHNIVLYEFNMDYFKKIWYSMSEKEKKKYRYLMMMDLSLEELKDISKKDRVVKKYMDELERVNEDPEFREFISAEEDNRKIENSLKKQYKREALEEARKEVLEEGRAEGLVEGRAEGERQKNLENARRMKEKNISITDISEITGLSIEEIEKL